MDATNPKHVDILKRQAQQEERNRRDFILHSMGVRAGRAYFCHLLEQCYVFATPYTGDNNRTNFNLGGHNLGLMILSDIMRHCPDHYVTMMRERNERDTITDGRLSRSDADSGRDPGAGANGNFVDYTAEDGASAGVQTEYTPGEGE